MKALVARSYGPVENLTLSDVPKPTPGPGQVLVRTEASALNAIDLALVTGAVKDHLPIQHPFVPGVDVTGVVEAVGEGVSRFGAGDRILAWNGVPSGGLAEYALVENAPSAALRPATLGPAESAALPTAALTAAALVDEAKPQDDERVLVVGASGGVGSFAVQLAKQTGAKVLATARADEEDLLRRLGADATVDYMNSDVTAEALRWAPGGVDVVIDLTHAGPALAGAAAAARPGGRLVSPLMGPPAFDRDVTAVYTGTRTPAGRLEALAAQAAEGHLIVEIGARYSFADAAQALTDYAHTHLPGKVVITF
ncbi:NADP-dependent oxidoreductase [Streptomyces sp. NBC_01571]|uniref:NADP-dependent oxidoreductase n=1 Tax=Streptomyces sp. NBC_01571 TaxID=2975883 RepID=UPI00224D9D99|nr:NADP-dependent oxidoreductase [Streptomyces sp. NBC_01571]MCX4579566.1 NADP-dependent oxidoreductase [Streptomyces sp. NBC_01571]